MIGDRLKFKRDLRVDFLRGLALLTIFIDHVPQNRWASVTQQNFGFSDAAELFVALAGFSVVLAYGRYFNGDQLRIGIGRVAQRVGTIYLFHIGTLVLACAIVASLKVKPDSVEHIQSMNLDALIAGDPETIAAVLLLVEQPKYFDILPLYVVLLAAFPLLYAMLRRSLVSGLAYSATIWLAVQFVPLNLPTLNGEGWHFNPFAWQFLLALGMAAALQVWQRGGVPRTPTLIGLAIAVLVISFVLRAPWTNWPLNVGAAPMDLAPYGAWMLKTNLGPARLIHIIAFGYLLLVLVPPRANWLKRPSARIVADAGANSLEVFCLGVILAIVAASIIGAFGRSAIVESWITTVGVAALLLAGLTFARDVRARKRTRSRASRVDPSTSMVRA